MSTKFAISVWGDPLNWSEVTYIIDGTEYLKEKSSTFVIGKHFGARILAFAPVTLVDACGNGHAPKEQEKIVHDYVKNPFKETDFEIIVAPALGTFKIGEKIVSFEGKPDLFKIFAFYRLFQILETIEDDLEIFVDLTYGPNYMALANYESIKLAVSLYCALRDKNGKVTVMNTDPFSRESKNLPIRINVADTLNFDRENGTAYISDELKRKFDINKFKWQKLFQNNNGSRVDTNEIKSLFTAMNNFGAYLPCMIKNEQMLNFLKVVHDTLEEFTSTVLSKMDYSTHTYRYNFSLREGVILIFCALKVLTSELFENKGTFVPLSNLEKLSETTFAQKTASILLSEELGKIKKNSEHLENNREILYRDLIERQGNNNPCGTNSRIIIAHSALEMNMIYLIRENNKVMIGYKECLDVLIKAIGNF